MFIPDPTRQHRLIRNGPEWICFPAVMDLSEPFAGQSR